MKAQSTMRPARLASLLGAAAVCLTASSASSSAAGLPWYLEASFFKEPSCSGEPGCRETTCALVSSAGVLRLSNHDAPNVRHPAPETPVQVRVAELGEELKHVVLKTHELRLAVQVQTAALATVATRRYAKLYPTKERFYDPQAYAAARRRGRPTEAYAELQLGSLLAQPPGAEKGVVVHEEEGVRVTGYVAPQDVDRRFSPCVSRGWAEESQDAWVPSSKPLQLLTTPGGRPFAVLQPSPSGGHALRRLGQRSGVFELVRFTTSKASIVGWVRRRLLRPPREPGGLWLTLRGVASGAISGAGRAPAAEAPRTVLQPGEHLHATRGGAVIGVVTERIRVAEATQDGPWLHVTLPTPLGDVPVWISRPVDLQRPGGR